MELLHPSLGQLMARRGRPADLLGKHTQSAKIPSYHFTNLSFSFRWLATGSSSPYSASSSADPSSCSAGGPIAATSSCPNPPPPKSLTGKAHRSVHDCPSGAVPARRKSTSWCQDMRCRFCFLDRFASSSSFVLFEK